MLNRITLTLSTAFALTLAFLYSNGTMLAKIESPRILMDNMPEHIFTQMPSRNRLLGWPTLTLQQEVVTVAFNGGNNQLYELIEKTAQEWTDNRNSRLRFSFRDEEGHFREWSRSDKAPASATIRIGFFDEPHYRGYWSALGRLSENISANEPTMNFEGFADKLAPYYGGDNKAEWGQSYEHTVVLHEFGHALGLSHEHFHPDCQSDMKMPEIIADLMGEPNNWSERVARFNMDAKYYIKVTTNEHVKAFPKVLPRHEFSKRIDQASVMLYSFPIDKFKSGARSRCLPTGERGFATMLSNEDVNAYLKYYQKGLSSYANRV